MGKSFSIALLVPMAFLIAALSACSGGGGGSSGSESSVSSVSTSTTMAMPANAEVLVPSGAIITSSNVEMTVNGSNNTVYTQVGAVLFVPSTATGTPNNTVRTGQPTPGSLSTSPPTVTVIAGSPTQNGVSQDGTGTQAVFYYVYTMAFDSSTTGIVVSDDGTLRLVTPLAADAGVVTTYQNAALLQPSYGVAVDAAGDIFASGDSAAAGPYEAYVQELTPLGAVTTSDLSWLIVPNNPILSYGGLAVDSAGNLYMADEYNFRIVTFTPAGVMSVFAGNGTDGDQDGEVGTAEFNYPLDVKIGPDGNFFVLEPSQIREITPQGVVSTITPVGPVTSANGLSYSAFAVDSQGDIFVAFATSTTLATSLMRISPNGTTTLFFNVVSDPITALTSDDSGNLYAATFGVGAQIFQISF